MRPIPAYWQLSLGLVALVGAGCNSPRGSARAREGYAFGEVAASPVLRLPLELAAGAQIVLETRNPSARALPVLHLWDLEARAEVARDAGGWLFGRGARIAYRNRHTQARRYALVLHAARNDRRGEVDLVRDGRLLLRRAHAGGVLLDVASGSGYVYQAAAAPGGVTETCMYALAGDGELLALDDASGPQGLPKIAGLDSVQQLVVGARQAEPGAGPVRVYVNDPDDGDGDGLGRALERSLGTCDGPREPGCSGSRLAAYYRAVRTGTRDTDRDGLSDADELFGVPGGHELDLPRFGTDPRHKDVLVEVDHHKRISDAGLSEQDIVEIAALFARGSAKDLRNPDGQPGVHLHLDVGFDPNERAHLGLFGNWGGSNQVAHSSYKQAHQSDFTQSRRRYFRYALLTRSGTGQASGAAFGINRDFHRVPVFAHELGHTLGLDHYGNDAWGRANCKPNYYSIMNYVYQNQAQVGFSSAAFSVLNPARAIESQGIGGQAPPGLSQAPLELDVAGRGIDWNRDGVISDTPVRAGLQWATYKSCGASGRARVTLAEGEQAASTPVLIKAGENLHALWIDAAGHLQGRHGRVSGPDAHGSCPLGDASAQGCMTWSDAAQVQGLSGVRQLAAVAMDDGRIALAYATAEGRLRSSVLAVQGTTSGAVPGVQGAALRVLGDVEIAGGHTEHAPSMAWMQVDEARYGVPRVLAIAWRTAGSSTGTLMLATALGPLGPFHVQPVLDARLQPISTALGPTLAGLGTGELCGVFSDPDAYIRFHCYDRARDVWVDLSAQAFYAGLGPRTSGRVGLAYHRYRAADGSLVGADPSRGAVYLSFTEPDSARTPDNPHWLISEWLSAQHGAFAQIDFRWRGSVIDQWTNLTPGTGIALYEDETLSALKALMAIRDGKTGATRIDFLPFADGAYDEDFGTGNDFELMERGICVGLRGVQPCGDRATGAY